MNRKFIKFSDWEASKAKSLKEESNNKKETKNPDNSELIAKLSDLQRERKQAIRDSRDFDAQILEVESKIIKLDIQRNDLQKKLEELQSAKVISEKERREGRTNVKE